MAYSLLIVDDSNIVRKVLMKAVNMSGLEISAVHEAEHGQQALEVLNKHWVDLVFLDINMPVMNGMEFMEKLRAHESLSKTPVVIVSTEGSKDRRDHLEQLGIDAYLRKPVTAEQIAEVVKSALQHPGQSGGGRS